MTTSRSTLGGFAAVVVAAVLLPATVASAHPGLRPNELRPGESIEAELIIPHGCGTEGERPEDAAQASPTVEVAVLWPEGIEIRPVEVDGWTTSLDDDVAMWEDDGGATTDAILLPLTMAAAVEASGDILVSVFQACENGETFRWAAAPGEDGDPGVALTVAGEPVPAPSTPAPSPSSPPTPSPTPTPTPTTTPTPTPTPAPSATPTPTPTPTATATPVAAAAASDDDGTNLVPWAVGGILIGAAIATFVIWRQRSGAGAAASAVAGNDPGSGPGAGGGDPGPGGAAE